MITPMVDKLQPFGDIANSRHHALAIMRPHAFGPRYEFGVAAAPRYLSREVVDPDEAFIATCPRIASEGRVVPSPFIPKAAGIADIFLGGHG